MTFKTYAASGTSGVKNEQRDDNATQANTEGAANADHANKSDPNTGGVNTTEELYLRIDDAADPGAALPIEVKMTTSLAVVLETNITVRTRIYQCNSNCDQAANWTQLGADQSTTVTFGLNQTDTGWVKVNGHPTLGTSGDITYYSVLAWAQDRQGADQPDPANADMRVNARSDQSNLKWVINPTTDKDNYNPTNGVNTDPVTITGTISYDYGATPADYGGTGEIVTVTPVDQNGTDLTPVTGTIAADGTFSISYTLPEAAEFGQWTVKVDYSHDGDAISQGSDTFLVNLAFSDVTYQLFQNDVSGGIKETNNTGSANMGVPIFITATPFNNPDNDSLTGIKIHWNVPTPPADSIFAACTSSCTKEITVPTGAGNAGAAEIEITGTEQNGTDPAVTVSSSISGFSDRAITLSTVWKLSTSATLVDNGVTTDFGIYNRGETVNGSNYIYNVRDELVKGEAANTLELKALKTGDADEIIISSNETVDANGFVDWSYVILSNHVATNDTTGSPKKLKVTDNDGNTVTSGEEWNVSSLLKLSTTGSGAPNNGIDMFSDAGRTNNVSVFNINETAYGSFYLYNVRDELWANKTGLTLDIVKAAGGNDTSVSGESSDANGKVEWSYLIANTHQKTSDATGSQKKLKVTDNDSNEVTSGEEWGVSDLLTVDNIWHSKFTSDTSEASQFFIGADLMQVKTHVQNVRGENKSGATVTCLVLDPDNVVQGDCDVTDSTSNADGYTDFTKIVPEPPAGTWTLRATATDGDNSTTANYDESVTYVSPYTAKFGIRTVGWNQEYHKGDTAEFTIQLLEKDASDNWTTRGPDSGTTPYYEIQEWTGSSWETIIPRTNMTVVPGTASSTWTSSYAIPNSDAQIGKKYSVSFNAVMGGAQIAQLKEFAVVQQLAGDPVTVAASPVRATANDTVRLTIHESNLDGTELTGNAANTYVYIYDPNNTVQASANGANPTELAHGTYYFNFPLGASPTNGVWQAVVVSVVDGNNYSVATNFEVNYQVAKETTSQTIKTNTENIEAKIDKLIVSSASVNDTGATTATFKTNLSNSTTDFYKNGVLVFTSGANAGQVRRIIAYNGTTKALTVDPALSAAPANGDTFTILSATAAFSETRASGLETDIQTIITNTQNIEGKVDKLIVENTSVASDASNSATSFKTNLTNSITDFYKNGVIVFTSGSNAGQVRRITGYNGTTKFVTVDPALSTTPSASDAFTILAATSPWSETRVANLESAITDLQTDVTYIRSKADSIYTDTQAILAKWGSTDAATIQGYVDDLETRLGTPTDAATASTVFGKIADIRDKWGTQTAQAIYDQVTNAYNKIQEVQTELGYNGKSTNAYTDIIEIRDYIRTVRVGTASVASDASNSATSFKTNLTNSITDFYKNGVIVFTSGSNAGQVRRITGYNGTTKFVTVDPALSTTPSASDAFTILAATSPLSETRVSKLEAGVVEKILNQETSVKSGNSFTIMFRAQSGLTGANRPLLNIYDASLNQRVTDQPMIEIDSTGVYQATTTFETAWGTGNFTIVVSTNNTKDSINLSVISTDLSTIDSTLNTVRTNVTKLTNFLVIAQSSVNDTTASTTAFVTNLTATTDDLYNENVLVFTSGTSTGAVRRISDYDGTTKKITVDPALPAAPADGDTFIILAQTINEMKTKVAEVKKVVDTVKTTTESIKSTTDSIASDVDSILSRVNTFETPSTVVYSVDINSFNTIANDLKKVLDQFQKTTGLTEILAQTQKNFSEIQSIRDETKKFRQLKTQYEKLKPSGKPPKPLSKSKKSRLLRHFLVRAVLF